ncbi:hypothetical protein AN618_04230 [Fervidicola ferrireducens]|uniref:Uncharacterized protein n=1 Tax=Fervidicola ferrireducens TaxID=520764 RepID=A0A140LCT2_9FIRM|nr:hypothetical protein AN618_04230 [Fervidicola ferrireducens]
MNEEKVLKQLRHAVKGRFYAAFPHSFSIFAIIEAVRF